MPLYTSLLPQFGAIMLVFLINFVLSDKESDLFRDISSTIDPIAAWEADQNPFACYNGGEENPKMSQKFLEFFDSTQTAAFKKNFIENSNKHTGLIGTVLDSSDRDLASTLTAAVNAFVVASQPEVNRTFQFFQAPWNPFCLQNLFEDFAENSSTPLFSDLGQARKNKMHKESGTFKLQYHEKRVRISGDSDVVLLQDGKNSQVASMEHMVEKIRKQTGSNEVFTLKSVFLKALWNPTAPLKEILKALWCTMGQKSNASYIGVYVPTYDITRNDGATLAQKYLNATYDACDSLSTSCPKNVLVIHENPDIYRSMSFLANTDFVMRDFKDALFQSERSIEEWSSAVPEEILPYIQSGYARRDAWVKRNREMMMSITLLAMGDQVVCPLSTDVCQIVALLRGDSRLRGAHDIIV